MNERLPKLEVKSEPLVLISLEEFLRGKAKNRRYPIESVNSFVYWIKKQGCPKRWPYSMWMSEFEKFINREVK